MSGFEAMLAQPQSVRTQPMGEARKSVLAPCMAQRNSNRATVHLMLVDPFGRERCSERGGALTLGICAPSRGHCMCVGDSGGGRRVHCPSACCLCVDVTTVAALRSALLRESFSVALLKSVKRCSAEPLQTD